MNKQLIKLWKDNRDISEEQAIHEISIRLSQLELEGINKEEYLLLQEKSNEKS